MAKIIRDMKTTVVKCKDGRTKGGTLLNDETVQPYVRELEVLEAKMASARDLKRFWAKIHFYDSL